MINVEKNNLYKILFNDRNSVNENILTHLYLPLIGPLSYQLYSWLRSENAIGISNDDVFIQDHERLFCYLSCNEEEFIQAKSNLENVGLLETFYDDTDEVFIYTLKKPLEVESFVNNLYLRDKLIEVIGNNEYQKTLIFLKPIDLNGIYKNISSSLHDVVSNENKEYLLDSYNFDFNRLVKEFLDEGFILELDEDQHNIIETYFKTNNYSYEEMAEIIKNSAVKSPSKSGVYFLNTNTFKKIIKQLQLDIVNTEDTIISSSNKFKNIRDINFFIDENYDPTKKNILLKWYGQFNFDQFYYLIIKDHASSSTIKAINLIQEKYDLDIDNINMITDFIIFRIGKWNLNYFKKVCQTLNNLNLKSQDSILFYLISINNNQDKNTNSINKSNVGKSKDKNFISEDLKFLDE